MEQLPENYPSNASLTLLDLPADIIKIIFGYDNAAWDYDDSVLHYESYTKELSGKPDVLNATMSVVIGSHTCKQLAQLLEVPASKIDEDVIRISYVAELAAQANHIQALRWAVDTGYYPWRCEDICKFAAMNDNLPMLKWVHSRGYTLTKKVANRAARNGNLEMYGWLMEEGCPWNHWTHVAAMRGGNIALLEYMALGGYRHRHFNKKCREKIIKHSTPDALIWAFSNGYSSVHYTPSRMLDAGRLDLLKRVREYNRPLFDASSGLFTPMSVVRTGSIEIVKWFVDEGYLNDAVGIFCAALKQSQIHICKWVETLPNVNAVFTTAIPVKAIAYSSIPATRYLIGKGCSWPDDALKHVVVRDIERSRGQSPRASTFDETKELIAVMLELGCNYDGSLSELYIDAGLPDKASWLKSIIDH